MPTALEIAEQKLAERQGSVLAMAESKLAERQAAESKFPEGTQILAEIEDGQVYQLPDGTKGFTSPAYSTVDPEQVAKIMEGVPAGEVSRAGLYEAAIEQYPIAARGAKFIQGIPFAGEYMEEAAGAVLGPRATQGMRAAQAAMEETRPVQAAALEVGGGIAGAIPAALAVGPSVIAAAPTGLAQKAVGGAAVGTLFGAIEGAIAGYGRQHEDRARGARVGGAVGGAVGGVMGMAAPMVAAGLKKMFTRVINRPIKEAAEEMGVSEDVIKALRQSIDFERAQVPPIPSAMLADISPEASGLLDVAMQTGARGSRAARDAIESRATAANASLSGVLDDVFGGATGRVGTAKAIRGELGKGVNEAYNAAYDAVIDYSSDQGRLIEELVNNRIPPKTLNMAINLANDQMRYQGNSSRQMLLEVGEDGVERLTEMPNVMQLDYIKRAFDQLRRSGTDPVTGKLSPDAMFSGQVARDIRNATASAVPEYRAALDAATDLIGQEEAVEVGYNLLRSRVTREAGQATIRGMTKAEKDAALHGVRTFIDDSMAAVRRTVTDPNVPAREVQKAIGELSSRANRSKIVALVGGDQATAIFKELDSAAIALNLRAAVTRNSATAARLAGKEAVEALKPMTALDRLYRGEGIKANQELLGMLTGRTNEAINARRQGLWADIADALTTIQDDDARKALMLMRKIDVLAPATEARASTIINGLTGYSALLADRAVLEMLQ